MEIKITNYSCYDNGIVSETENISNIMDAISGTSCLDPEEVLASELGLEPDYFIYFL